MNLARNRLLFTSNWYGPDPCTNQELYKIKPATIAVILLKMSYISYLAVWYANKLKNILFYLSSCNSSFIGLSNLYKQKFTSSSTSHVHTLCIPVVVYYIENSEMVSLCIYT